MADNSGQQRELVFCHACQHDWMRAQHGLQCPNCQSDAVEIIDERLDPREDHITISDDDSEHMPNNGSTNHDNLPRNLPRHPLHHHNPWQANVPDPDEPDIEHVEWNPSPGIHFSRTSYRSTTPGRRPNGPGDPFAPIFRSFSAMYEGIEDDHRPPGSPRTRSPNHIHRPAFTIQNPFQHHDHGHFHPPMMVGGGNVFTATGRWPPNATARPTFRREGSGGRDGGNVNNVHALLATVLQSMQASMTDQGNGAPNGMPNLHAFISAVLGNGQHGDAVYTDEALDRIISQMMEQQNAHGAPGPASEAAISALPKQEVTKSMMGSDGKAECSVCMDSVELGDEVTMLPCKHWFHGECVGAWLKEHDTCPHCRKGIMPKDGPDAADAPRSPDQEPRHDRNIHRTLSIAHTPIPPGMTHPPPLGAFAQPGMQQPYMPGSYRNIPDPVQIVASSGQQQQQPGLSPGAPPPPQQQQQQQHHHTHNYNPSRRRSSARERHGRSSGEGSNSTGGSSSGSGGTGVTGWFRRHVGGSG